MLVIRMDTDCSLFIASATVKLYNSSVFDDFHNFWLIFEFSDYLSSLLVSVICSVNNDKHVPDIRQ